MTARQTLTIRQLYALARRAGLQPADAAVAAAVGMAESSGRTWVTSPNPDGGTNVGIWQLDTPGGEGAGYTAEELADPWTNAKVMAKTTQQGKNWGPWQTYDEGTYEQFLPAAQAAQKSEPAPSQGSDTGGSWISQAIHGIEGVGKAIEGAGGQAASTAGGIALPAGITDFFSAADKFAEESLWILNPSNWMRILSGFMGFILLAAGIVVLVRAA